MDLIAQYKNNISKSMMLDIALTQTHVCICICICCICICVCGHICNKLSRT